MKQIQKFNLDKIDSIFGHETSCELLDSLERFNPPEEYAIRLYIVLCGGSKQILKPYEVTLEIVTEVLNRDSDVEDWQIKHIYDEFRNVFNVNKG